MTHSADNEDIRQDALVRKAAALPREIEPPRDLWPEISAALEVQQPAAPSTARPPWMLAAAGLAAALVLVALSSATTWWMIDGRYQSSYTELLAALESDQSTFGATLLGPEFMVTRNALLADLEQNLNRLSPRTRGTITKNLVEIHRSVEEINAALRSDPSNGSLQKLLFTTYQQELALLAEINRLAEGLPAEMS